MWQKYCMFKSEAIQALSLQPFGRTGCPGLSSSEGLDSVPNWGRGSAHPGCFYEQVGNWSCLPWGFSSPDVGARLSVPVGLFIHPFSTVNWAWDTRGGSTDEHADQVPVLRQVMVTATRQGAPRFPGHVTVHWPPAKFPAGGNVLTGLPPTTVSAPILWICTAAYYFSFRITCSSVCAVAVRSELFSSFF